MGIFSDKIRVGVLRGGGSPEYKVSLETGARVLENLNRDIYEPRDILVSKAGIWHENGFEKPAERILKNVDVIFNALRGIYDEDGAAQKILDDQGALYTGSGRMVSRFAANKIISKKFYKRNGLKTPFAVSINLNDLSREAIREAYQAVPHPFVVKPATAGSSLGVGIAYSLPELEEFTVAAFEYSPSVLIEEYIPGKEVTCGVVDDFRGRQNYSLIPFSEQNISEEEKEKIQAMAILAHNVLELRHYSSSDFIIHPKRGIFILETDALPPIHSRFEDSLKSVGAKLGDFLHHVIGLAMNKK